jgi:uncharacterized protein YndB with AHSA1/START domain
VVGAAVRAQIATPPEQLWAIVADVSRHPELAGSGEPQETRLEGSGPIGVGSRFESKQRAMGMPYRSHSEVTACEPPRLLRWVTDGSVTWEFRFEPDGQGGSRVLHGYQWSVGGPGVVRAIFGPLLDWRNRQNARGMVASVRNLARLAGRPETSGLEVSWAPPPEDGGLTPG